MGKSVLNLLANQIISHHTGLHDYVDIENILQEKYIPKEINIDNINIDKTSMIKELRESPLHNQELTLNISIIFHACSSRVL